MLFQAMATAHVFDNPPWRLWLAFFPAAMIIYGIGLVFARWAFHRTYEGAVITGMGASYGNTLLLGIPLIFLVLGEEGLLAGLLIISAHSLILMTLTTVLLEGGRAEGGGTLEIMRGVVLGMVTNPVILGLVAGLTWNALALPIPGVLNQVLLFLKGAVVPCSLFALGATLARYGMKGRLAQSLVVTVLKLLVMPAIVWVSATYILELNVIWTAAAVLMAAQPTGVNMYLFASRYGTAEAIASTTIFVSTLAAVVVMPVLIYLLGVTQS